MNHFFKIDSNNVLISLALSPLSDRPDELQVTPDLFDLAESALRSGLEVKYIDGDVFTQAPEAKLLTANQWRMVRDERDTRLADSDWVRLKALDNGVAVPSAWLIYRQALRDVTVQKDPFKIVWPVAP